MQWNALPSGKPGRQYTYSDSAIQFALTIRNLFQLPLRQTQGFITAMFKLAHLDLDVPDYSTLSRRSADLEVTICRAIRPGESLNILVDSTGIKLCGDGEWVRMKHGVQQHRQWLKLHLAIDANTQQIHAIEVTSCQVSDAEVLDDLLGQVEQPIERVTGDGAYDTKKCLEAIIRCNAQPVIPPRRNARSWPDGPVTRARNEAIRQCELTSRREWKKATGYHRRSLVEAAMHRLKRLGQGVTSRRFANQVTDLQLRVNIVNRFLMDARPVTIAV